MNMFKSIKDNYYITSKNNIDIKIIANKKIFNSISPIAIDQLLSIPDLPNIYGPIIGLPDLQPGYGVPIGSCFASEYKDGIISSEAVGFDIGCGIRLIKTNLNIKNISRSQLKLIANNLKKLPLGLSNKGLKLTNNEFLEILHNGVNWCVTNNYCKKKDKNYIENKGVFKKAETKFISKEAIDRGKKQIGTLGQGNHFIDILEVQEIFNKSVSKKFGFEKGQICIMLHSGSRGFGHQIAKDYNKSSKYKIPISYNKFHSDLGQKYYLSMLAAENFAFVNRSIISYDIIRIIEDSLNVGQNKLNYNILYDFTHNIVSVERHNNKKLIIHRKGATRVWHTSQIPKTNVFSKTGTPIILPGSMLSPSYIVIPKKNIEKTFSTAPHGSGRILSRLDAKKSIDINKLKSQMLSNNIILSGRSENIMREEQPMAYRSSSDVVESMINMNLIKKIIKLKPIIVVTG